MELLLKFLTCLLGTALTLIFVQFNAPYATSQGMLDSYQGRFKGIFRYLFIGVSYVGYGLHWVIEFLVEFFTVLVADQFYKKGRYVAENFLRVLMEFLVYALSLMLMSYVYLNVLYSFGANSDADLLARRGFVDWFLSLFTYLDVMRYALEEHRSFFTGFCQGILACFKVGVVTFLYYAIICGFLSEKIVKIELFDSGEEETEVAPRHIEHKILHLFVSTLDNFKVTFSAFYNGFESFSVIVLASTLIVGYNFIAGNTQTTLLTLFWNFFPLEALLKLLATFVLSVLFAMLLERLLSFTAEHTLPQQMLDNLQEYSQERERIVQEVQATRVAHAIADRISHCSRREEATTQQAQWEQQRRNPPPRQPNPPRQPTPPRQPSPPRQPREPREPLQTMDFGGRNNDEQKEVDSYCRYLVQRKKQVEKLQRNNPNKTDFAEHEIWEDTAFVIQEDRWPMFKLGRVPEGYTTGMENDPKYNSMRL